MSYSGYSGRLHFAHDEPKALLTMDDMFPSWTAKDITRDLLKRFLLPVPKGRQVVKASMCVVGGQGCGKSVFFEWLAGVVNNRYGADRVHIIYTDDIRVAIREIDDRPVQLLIIDDAMTYASSRQVFKQTDILADYNRSRHVFEDRLDGRPGVILYCWGWQRFGELDPAFRQSDVLIFKSGISEKSERAKILEFVGPVYIRYLWEIWDRISRGDNEAKNSSVGVIASLPQNRGVGIFRSAFAENVLPPLRKHSDVFPDGDDPDGNCRASKEAPQSTKCGGSDAQDLRGDSAPPPKRPRSIRDARRDPAWARRMRVWDYKQSHPRMSNKAMSKNLGETPSYISNALRQVRSLMADGPPAGGSAENGV